jgi:tight adherence protein B
LNKDLVTIVLFSVLIFCVLGLIVIIYWLYQINSQNLLKRRITNFIDSRNESQELLTISQTEPYSQSAKLEGIRGRINHALSIFSTDKLRLKIASAYWPISDIEFVFIRFAISLLGFVIGWIIPQNIIGGLGLGVLFYFVPGFFLDRSIINRRKKFQDQLLDFLVLIKGAVLAGFSLTQSLDMAVKEIPAPTSEEFGQVLREVRFGFPLEQALQNLTDRMQSDDLQIVVTAIMLNTQMGGSLAAILEATIDTIRERIHLYGEIRSLTSYARYVGLLISLLPFLTALVIYLLNPGYFDTVKTSLIAQLILLMALISIFFGNFLIRQTMKIRV